MIWCLASGGALASQGNKAWRWLFYLNLPLAGVAFILAVRYLSVNHPEGSIRHKLAQVDWLDRAGYQRVDLRRTTIYYIALGSWPPKGFGPNFDLTQGLFPGFPEKFDRRVSVPIVLVNLTTEGKSSAGCCISRGNPQVLAEELAPKVPNLLRIGREIRETVARGNQIDILTLRIAINPGTALDQLITWVEILSQDVQWVTFHCENDPSVARILVTDSIIYQVKITLATPPLPADAFTIPSILPGLFRGVTHSISGQLSPRLVYHHSSRTLSGRPVLGSNFPAPGTSSPDPCRKCTCDVLWMFSFTRAFSQTRGITISSTILQVPPGFEIADAAILTMIGIAGLGLLLSLLMKEVPMGTSVDETYTLKEKLSKGLGRHEMTHQISPGGLTYLAQDFSLTYLRRQSDMVPERKSYGQNQIPDVAMQGFDSQCPNKFNSSNIFLFGSFLGNKIDQEARTGIVGLQYTIHNLLAFASKAEHLYFIHARKHREARGISGSFNMNRKVHYLTPVNGMSRDDQTNVQNEASSQSMDYQNSVQITSSPSSGGEQRNQFEQINKSEQCSICPAMGIQRPGLQK
ncbi:hypothetical protein DFH08DRAFT_808566 [Mycena albidolilacea]|uniref:Major facilitator superfamily (MFS) profile domain-containing protein n=1 Tax=Mycena albidolilacea TaxID=1033008 RepID=A0AAD7A1S7_9AGAR|nr:hypothetical protein DFH08DRAFT_808566 [Mycena albidolilacea]